MYNIFSGSSNCCNKCSNDSPKAALKFFFVTGTGFIKTVKSIDGCFALAPDSSACTACHPSSKGNPATNEWTPSADSVTPVSDKPRRSDI